MGTIDTINCAAPTSTAKDGKSGHVRRLNVLAMRIIAWLELCLERRRSRLVLLELTDEQLADIGISRSDAYREGIRSFTD
jgi:uncharacterized protein YjiS (DUF1127 family)